jgi:chromosome segregation ATPase
MYVMTTMTDRGENPQNYREHTTEVNNEDEKKNGIAVTDICSRSRFRELLCSNQETLEELKNAVDAQCSQMDASKEETARIRDELAVASETIKKRDNQVVTARQRALAAGEQLKEAKEENENLQNSVKKMLSEKAELEREIERLTTENKEFKKVSRVVALENETTRLMEENERLNRALFAKTQRK